MLPAKNRLTKKKDFDAVFEKGKSVKSTILWCKVLQNNLSHSRVGFVVSKKISPKAVVRNKVRRRLQSSVAAVIGQVSPFVDVVVVALPGIQNKEFEEVKEAVTKVFGKIVQL